ncbi:hypothetical protein AG4045_003933 [Apium graveolens]|uniref:Bromo domain-containing protein n=1 Tax=Apium graveolens TaxID=4045 RepID=A0A6L5B840_APIGR|nr:hypothetical protein AG4045_003933 [Apium graveolens]
MSISPERETKRKRLVKTMELDPMEIRKVERLMMKKCGGILDKLMTHRNGWVFNNPVDVVGLRLIHYHLVVKRPMYLGTVRMKLDKGDYRNPLDFAKDVRLTFYNAIMYN